MHDQGDHQCTSDLTEDERWLEGRISRELPDWPPVVWVKFLAPGTLSLTVETVEQLTEPLTRIVSN